MNKYIKYIIVITLLIAGLALWIKLSHRQNTDEITLKDTPAIIEATRPIGVLYLYTTVTEDYVKDTFEGSGIGSAILGQGNGLFKRKHDCVQILRQQVSLTMDLNKVRYEPIANSDTVMVYLPDVEITQSTIGSWFLSDNEDEEGKVQFDASPLIKRTEQKIEKRYNTQENRDKAYDRAKETLSGFLKQCGKVAVFME